MFTGVFRYMYARFTQSTFAISNYWRGKAKINLKFSVLTKKRI